MSNNGPTAAQVAAAHRVQEIEARMRVLDPVQYEEYRQAKLTEGFSGGAVLVVCLVIGFGVGSSTESIGPLILAFVVGAVLCALIVGYGKAPKMRDEFEKERIPEEDESKKMVKEIKQRISDDEAMRIGDTIIAHEGATIVSKSIIMNSFNTLNERDPELAQALKQLAGYVEASGDKKAGEAFDNLAEAVDRSQKPSVIRAFWNDLVSIMPDVATVGTAAAAITKLFL